MALSLPYSLSSLLPPVYSLLFTTLHILPPPTLHTLPPFSLPSQLLQREYGDYLVAPEPNFDISVQFDYESLPENKGSQPPLSPVSYSWLCQKLLDNPSQPPLLVAHIHTLWFHYETQVVAIYPPCLASSQAVLPSVWSYYNAHAVSSQKLDGDSSERKTAPPQISLTQCCCCYLWATGYFSSFLLFTLLQLVHHDHIW